MQHAELGRFAVVYATVHTSASSTVALGPRVSISAQKVLIISAEPIIGALLGIYVELSGWQPAFAGEEQSAADAVAQCDPAIVLVDLEHRDGASPSFVAHERARGRRVIVFSSRARPFASWRRDDLAGVPAFAMPIDAASFRAVLNGAR